jgi:hypothetical protein
MKSICNNFYPYVELSFRFDANANPRCRNLSSPLTSVDFCGWKQAGRAWGRGHRIHRTGPNAQSRANFLLDAPAFPLDRLKRLLATRSDLIFIPAEAILALEAVASSIARPNVTALNLVSSPYGAYFGTRLRRAGATVHDVVAAGGNDEYRPGRGGHSRLRP